MNRKVAIPLIAVPLIIILGIVAIYFGSQDKLPGQTPPTRIPATAFANLPTSAPAAATTVSVAATPSAAATALATIPAPAVGANTPAASTATVAATATKAPAAATTTTGSTAAGTTAPGASSVAPAGTTATGTIAASGSTPAGATTYSIVADQSQAKATANEKLAMLPAPSDATEATNAIQGNIILGADGKPTDGSKIQVDLRTLKSDQARRDNYIQMNTLQTAMFPLAEVTITGVDGWQGPLKDGQQASFKMLGNMTIHGVTKPVIFDTTATMQGGTLMGTATTQVKFADFGMTAPNLNNFVVVTDNIKIELNIMAKKAA